MPGVLNQRESVDALATGREGANSEFMRGRTRWSENQDLLVRGLFGQKGGGALKEGGVGAGMK